MLSSLFKSFNQLKQQTLARQILDDIYDQSKSQMLSSLKYTKITYSNTITYEEKLVGILSNSLRAVINFDSLTETSNQEKTAIKQTIVKKLLEEAQKHESTCFEINDVSGGWGSYQTETETYHAKGLSYSRIEIGYGPPPYGHYELYAINFPLSLFADSRILERQIYTCLESKSNKILKTDYFEKSGIELATIKI